MTRVTPFPERVPPVKWILPVMQYVPGCKVLMPPGSIVEVFQFPGLSVLPDLTALVEQVIPRSAGGGAKLALYTTSLHLSGSYYFFKLLLGILDAAVERSPQFGSSLWICVLPPEKSTQPPSVDAEPSPLPQIWSCPLPPT